MFCLNWIKLRTFKTGAINFTFCLHNIKILNIMQIRCQNTLRLFIMRFLRPLKTIRPTVLPFEYNKIVSPSQYPKQCRKQVFIVHRKINLVNHKCPSIPCHRPATALLYQHGNLYRRTPRFLELSIKAGTGPTLLLVGHQTQSPAHSVLS